MYVEEKLKKVEDIVLDAIRKGEHEKAARIAFEEIFRPLFDLIAKIEENIASLTEKVDKNTENIAKLTENVDKLLGETGRLRGRDVELRTGLMLQEWFRRHAPEYEVFIWDGAGADLLVEGKGVLASIEITIKPKAEDIRQIKSGVGAVMDDWGRKPDLLIVYSRSGVIPKKVAEIAEKMGVKLARRPADIKRMLDLQSSSH
jgi:predicted house-cleaning noncanonical NTP pyrophosphatase (MazG superfamily)